MIPIETIAIFSMVSVALALAPGPDNIFVLTQSALHGRKAGFLVTIGLCTAIIRVRVSFILYFLIKNNNL
ncbi:putative membrane protein [uncultured Candidatus Thioglobus sp.]|nr:putative membrane protein [uncultured Candidatus Thioglobus sp.]